jgi:hypothetical protein
MVSGIRSLECAQGIRNMLDGGRYKERFSNNSPNDDLDSEFKKSSWKCC